MTDLCARDVRVIDELNHELESLSPDGGVPFDVVLGETRLLLESQNAVIAKMRPTETAWA